MIKDDKGSQTPIQSMGKFEDPNARCLQRKFMFPNIKFGHSLLDSHFKCEEGEVFDKKQIAIAIKNSTLNDDVSCSLLDEGILN